MRLASPAQKTCAVSVLFSPSVLRPYIAFRRYRGADSCYVVVPEPGWMFGCRYLVARTGSVCKATKALVKTLHWRQKFRPDLITWEQVRTCCTQSACVSWCNLQFPHQHSVSTCFEGSRALRESHTCLWPC